MKRPVVVLLAAVLGVALLCLGASQKLTNQTGAPASGVTLTFSDAVRITSYDKSVFPTQFPVSGESESFTFSGRTLGPGGTFGVGWSPDGVRVRSARWLGDLSSSTEAKERGVIPARTSRRGVNVNLNLVLKEDIELLAHDWEANLVRIWMGEDDWGLQCEPSVEWPSGCPPIDLERLDRVLDWCEEYGIQAVINVQNVVGNNIAVSPRDFSLWNSSKLQEDLLGLWRSIAARCARRGDVVYGYDLLNEPRIGGTDKGLPAVWNDLVRRIAQVIRTLDPRHAIIVECGIDTQNFHALQVVDDPNVIYSFHFGEPYAFTHQGLEKDPSGFPVPVGVRYPSSGLNKAYLRLLMEPAVDFAKRYGVRMYVGELIAYCYIDSESRRAYLRDCMDIFEEYGWDYTYCAYRNAPSQSLEHVGYQTAEKWIELFVGETPAMEVFREYLSRNVADATADVKASRPRCVFDASHTRKYPEQAVRYTNLEWRLTALCDVGTHTSGPITDQVLDGADLLVVGSTWGTSYTPQELTTMERFVRAGGHVLAYCRTASDLNLLLSRFGILVDASTIAVPPSEPGQDPARFYIREFEGPENLVGDIPALLVNNGTSLNVEDPAVVIARTPDSAWRDADDDLVQDPSEDVGSFPLVAISECGQGRIAVVSDDEFRDADTWPTYAALVSWLLDGDLSQTQDVRTRPGEEPVIEANAESQTPTRSLSFGPVGSVGFSPDGRYLAVAGDAGAVRLVETKGWTVVRTLDRYGFFVTTVAFSPDGTLLASGSDDTTVRLWDVATGQLLRTLSGHAGQVDSVGFSPDGSLLVSGSWDQTAKVWDVATGEEVATLAGHSLYVWPVAFSPDGKLIATGAWDGMIKLWKVAKGPVLKTLKGHDGFVNCVAFSPDGMRLASGASDNRVILWDVATGSALWILLGHTSSVNSVAFSSDGAILASGSSDKTIILWDVVTRRKMRTLTGHADWVNSVAFSPDGTLLASGGQDGVVNLWTVPKGD